MNPARWPRDEAHPARLLRIDPAQNRFSIGLIGDLAAALAPGDLVVVNDAATLPASLSGWAWQNTPPSPLVEGPTQSLPSALRVGPTQSPPSALRLGPTQSPPSALRVGPTQSPPSPLMGGPTHPPPSALEGGPTHPPPSPLVGEGRGGGAPDAPQGPAPVELRLAGELGPDRWRAVVFGAGDWRTPTEHRPPAPKLAVGDRLQLGEFEARVVGVDPQHPRLVEVVFDRRGQDFWRALYQSGRPVQYAYLDGPLALWQVQTPFAARPWASEAPSAAFALSWALTQALARQGVELASLTHAAGLSSTGDEALDACLPLPERYEIPEITVAAVRSAKARGGKVLAVGTTVARALEGCAAANHGALVAGEGVTDWLLGEGVHRAVVDGILTGVHDLGTSHFSLLHAFAGRPLLGPAHQAAADAGLLGHEFGDAVLVW